MLYTFLNYNLIMVDMGPGAFSIHLSWIFDLVYQQGHVQLMFAVKDHSNGWEFQAANKQHKHRTMAQQCIKLSAMPLHKWFPPSITYFHTQSFGINHSLNQCYWLFLCMHISTIQKTYQFILYLTTQVWDRSTFRSNGNFSSDPVTKSVVWDSIIWGHFWTAWH